METKPLERDEIAELTLIIPREQERIAELYRHGQRPQARRARDTLFKMMHRVDLLQALKADAC